PDGLRHQLEQPAAERQVGARERGHPRRRALPGEGVTVEMKILRVSGRLLDDSHNTALLRCAARHLPEGVELEVWDGLRDIPPYDNEADDDPATSEVTQSLGAPER